MQAIIDPAISTLELIPSVIAEELAHPFKFHMAGQIREGMRHQNELHGLVNSFDTGSRLQAYQFACELILSSATVIVTVSKQRYAVWLNLRSPQMTRFMN
jgi:hypothetical protein